MSETSADDVINKDSENQDTGAKRAGERVKSEASKKAKKTIKKAKEQSKYAKGGISKLAYYILAFLIIIIMVVGFVFFIINVPGSIQGKMAKKFSEILGLDDYAGELEYKQQKTDLLNYINQMGFDPVGMGFATLVGYKNQEETDNSQEKEIDYYEDYIGVELNDDIKNKIESKIKSLGIGELLKLKSEIISRKIQTTKIEGKAVPILSKYLNVLDWYMYAYQRMYESKEINNKVKSAIFGSNADDTSGTGLLNIYGEDLKFGDDYQIDRENLKLTFYNLNGFFKTDIYQYDMDGWAGRYGTPLELLLSLHASTMMPDLVTEFVSNPNLQTIVNIEAKEVELGLDVKLTREAEDGKEEEVIINVGNSNDETLGKDVFKVNEDGSIQCNYTYKVEDTGENLSLKEALYQKKISLFNIYKTFQQFNCTYNDTVIAEGDDGRLQRIKKFLSIDNDNEYMYIIPNVSRENDDLIQLTSSYLGDVENFETNKNYTFNYNGGTIKLKIESNNKMIYDIDFAHPDSQDIKEKTVTLLKIAKPAKFYKFLKENKQIIEGYENFVDINDIDWYTYIYYKGMVESLIDIYMANLVNYNQIIKENINYTDNKYGDSITTVGPLSLAELKANTDMFNEMKNDRIGQVQGNSVGHVTAVNPTDNEVYNYYLDIKSNEFNNKLEKIRNDINTVEDYKNGAEAMEKYFANELGITVDQMTEICKLMEDNQEKIKTYVPTIQSVVKHWYKDLIFNYKNMLKGTVFTTEYTGDNKTGVKLYYKFTTKDSVYPAQDGEPYVIKGDSVTQNGKEVPESEITVDEGTKAVLGDYELGDGYKLARKLFTQGYYYQYDGSEATSKEIALAKKLETYSQIQELIGEEIVIKVTIMQGRIHDVIIAEEGKQADTDEKIKETGAIIYYINPPSVYVSPISDEGLADPKKTKESVDSINECLKDLGTDLRRKKVNITYNTTALTALSMLEGMHTLDGEYTYREFKEFLIELGYYSRAELEAVETDVLDWFMPGFTPDNWPPIKSDEEILEYGTTILSSSNVVASGKLSIDKINNMENFTFFKDKQGIISYTDLSDAGNNIKIWTEENLTSEYIIEKVETDDSSAICIYLSSGTDGDLNDSVKKVKELINEIREELKDNEEKCNIPIYMIQVLPIEKPALLDGNSDDVMANQNISNYNINLFAICSGQDNVKCIDATSDCVDSEGWLKDFDSTNFTKNIISKIVKKNVSNGGFEEGVTVMTPGAGYITSISEKEITIEFSLEMDPSLKPIDGFTMVISGFAVDPDLLTKFSSEATKDEEGNKRLPIEKGTIIGLTTTDNVKLILRDRNKAIINNIEDYMGLPQSQEISEWELLYFLPKESGGIDNPENGVESIGIGTNEVAIGIIQWTTNSEYNNVAGVFKKFIEKDSELCGTLLQFTNWNSQQVINDIKSESSQIKKELTAIANKDRDKFLAIQVECMKEDYGKLTPETEWILERRSVVYGTYISAKVWAGVNSGIDDVINSGMSDEELVIAILNKAREEKGSNDDYNEGWNNRVDQNKSSSQTSLALRIINGEYSEEEIEELVRKGY